MLYDSFCNEDELKELWSNDEFCVKTSSTLLQLLSCWALSLHNNTTASNSEIRQDT